MGASKKPKNGQTWEALRARARELHVQNVSQSQIARTLGCAQATVSRWLRPPVKRVPFSKAVQRRRRAKQLALAGWPLVAIARELGLSESYAGRMTRAALKDERLAPCEDPLPPLPALLRERAARRQFILEWWRQGWSQKDLARALGLASSTVWKVVDAARRATAPGVREG